MSWFTDMAGRAEQILNQVDQRAGQALTNTPERESLHSTPKHQPPPAYVLNKPRVADVLSTKQLGQSAKQESYQPSQPPHLLNVLLAKSNHDSDQHLFDYLNSEKSISSPSPSNTKHHSRQSSRGSTSSAIRTLDNNDSSPTDSLNGSLSQPFTPIASSESSSSLGHLVIPDELDEGAVYSREDGVSSREDGFGSRDDVLGSREDRLCSREMQDQLQLENNLLKNELCSLNNEMMTVMERSRDSQEMVKAYSKREKMMQDNQIEGDEQMCLLRGELNNSSDLIDQSNRQVLLLEKRLDEMKTQFMLKSEQFETINSDRDRILNEHSSVSGVQGQAMESLKLKLSSVEIELEDSLNVQKKLKIELMERQTTLDQEKLDISENLAILQSKLQDEKAQSLQLNLQLKQSKTSSDIVKSEFSIYKEKATRILLSKDKLLTSLKNECSDDGVSGLTVELTQTSRERDLLRDEVVDTRNAIQTLRANMQDLESQLEIEAEAHTDQLQRLHESQDIEKSRRVESESEFMKLKLEHRYTTDELQKQRLSTNRQITDRDGQIEILRTQMTTKNMSSWSSEEQERQVHCLTERLIQKQGIIEVLNSEKNSLALQLERTEKQYRESEVAAARATTTLNMNSATGSHETDGDDLRQRLPNFLRTGLNDGQMTRRVKSAANSIDRFRYYYIF